MKFVFKAWYESNSGNEFEAYGTTADQATATLIQTMECFGDRNGKPRSWWRDEDDLGIAVREIELGVGFLDALVYMKNNDPHPLPADMVVAA